MTTALPVAYYLTELSGEPSRRGARGVPGFGADGAPDVELQVSEAHARGILEGRAAAQAEQDAAIAGLTASFEQKIAAERQRWVAEQGAHLGEMIATAIEGIEQRVAEVVSQILKPILSEQVRVRAVDELSQTLNAMLTKGEYAKITVSGPQDLLSTMEARLGSHAGLSFVASEGVDVTVSADETILETRFGAWADAIEGRSL